MPLPSISVPPGLSAEIAEASAPAKPFELRCINRVGPGDGTAWSVFLRRSGRSFRKNFADAKHGGEDGALTAAKTWRDEIDRLHPAMNKQQQVAARKSPGSGKRGVVRSSLRQLRKDGTWHQSHFWEATAPSWHKPMRVRRFFIAKHGEAEAFRMAVAAREAFEAAAEAAGQQAFRAGQPGRKAANMRNITRVGHANNGDRAWIVIIKRATLPAPLNKRFSDRSHGDQAASLNAAQAWRDEMERLHPQLDRKARLARPTKASRSGVKGVFQQYTPRRLADGSTRVSTFWSAKTPTGILPERTRCFSIDKYGEREAFRMAVEARKAFEARLLAQTDDE